MNKSCLTFKKLVFLQLFISDGYFSMSSSILAENQMKKSQMDDISCAKKKLETGNIGCHILTPQSQGSNIAMPVGHAGHMMSFPAVGHRHLFPLMTNRTGSSCRFHWHFKFFDFPPQFNAGNSR